jgi:dipeptidyl aminopeptidase/acylaminoacyl peptidase
LHGTKDKTVPTRDAFSYFEKLRSNPGRSSDKVELQLIEGADHLYKSHQEEVADAISQWYHRKTTAPIKRELAKL